MDGGGGGSEGFDGLHFSESEFIMPNVGDPPNQNDPIDTSYNIPDVIIKDKDHFIPISYITHIMRKALPSYAKISNDSKEAVQDCVTEFIGFITGEAKDNCQQEQRKTMTGDDILLAMSKLGFDNYFDLISLFLSRYRKEKDIKHGVVRDESFIVNMPQSSLAEPRVTFFGGMTSLSPLLPLPPQPLQMRSSGRHQEIYGEGPGGNLFGMLNSDLRDNNDYGWNGDGSGGDPPTA